MNKPLHRAYERQKLIKRQSRELLDLIDEQQREPTDSETKLLESNTAELEELGKYIEVEEAKMPQLTEAPMAGFMESKGVDDWTNPPKAIGTQGKVGARYRDLFGGNLSTDGWDSMQQFCNTIYSGMSHPNLRCLTEGSGPDGGFLVPTQYAAEMLDQAIEASVVMSRARIYPMETREKVIAGFDASTSSANSLFGGIESQWLSETGTAEVTNPTVRKITLIAHKLALLTSSSNEVLADGMDLTNQLNEAMTSATAWFLDYAFLRGDGISKPLGCLNDPAKITVDKQALQAADTVVYENLTDMYARLHPGCHNNAVWVVNPSTIPDLLELNVTIGTSGSHIPMTTNANGGWTLLGRPVVVSEKVPEIGDEGDVILADFSQYCVGLRSKMTLEKSGHVYFTSDQTAWRAITRVDGQGRWDGPYTPPGGTTQSWIVTLEDR